MCAYPVLWVVGIVEQLWGGGGDYRQIAVNHKSQTRIAGQKQQ